MTTESYILEYFSNNGYLTKSKLIQLINSSLRSIESRLPDDELINIINKYLSETENGYLINDMSMKNFINSKELNELINKMERTSMDNLHMEECLYLFKDRHQKLINNIKYFSTSKEGKYISEDKFERIMKSGKDPHSDDELKEMIKEAPKDAEGKGIIITDFVDLILSK
jgi:Ca2+-binding EF-hand superfamily protein